MKKTKVWLRWIALTLLVILCINSVGSIALASEIQEEGYDSEAELLEEKSSTEAELQNEEGASEEKSQEEGSVSEEKSQEEGSVSEESNTPEDKTSPEQQEAREASSNTQEVAEGYDIDFYVIINGEKVKLQHNNITGIKTWKEKRTTYYGVSLDDLILVYEEFGFVKGSDGQNPVADEKFVSAYRGKSGIEYGKVYTDTESGKTYVSYNYGQNKQGEAIDVYYLPNGKGVALNLIDSVKKDNSFYSVEVKGEGQDRIRYALTGTVVEEAVADFNPQLSDQTDQIEWTCMGTDDKVIDGIRESGNQTRFTIGKITQSYVIQRADQTALTFSFIYMQTMRFESCRLIL